MPQFPYAAPARSPLAPGLPETSRETPREGGAGTTGIGGRESVELRLRNCRGQGERLDPSKIRAWSQADGTHPQLGAPIHAAPAEAATEAAAPDPRRPPPSAGKLSRRLCARPRPAQAPPTRGYAPPLRLCPAPAGEDLQPRNLKGGAGGRGGGWNWTDALKDSHPFSKSPGPSYLPQHARSRTALTFLFLFNHKGQDTKTPSKRSFPTPSPGEPVTQLLRAGAAPDVYARPTNGLVPPAAGRIGGLRSCPGRGFAKAGSISAPTASCLPSPEVLHRETEDGPSLGRRAQAFPQLPSS